MRRTLLDLDVLASLASGVELGSFARAADRLGRSTSAVSAQMKKLEEQAGVAILRKSGRGLELTPAGEVLLSYARRLLELNDEAVEATRGASLAGCVRLGLAEDFGEGLLPQALGRFARACSDVRVEMRVARSQELQQLVMAGELDLALAWDSGPRAPHSAAIGRYAVHWIGPASGQLAPGPLPLALFDPPCVIRAQACGALDRAGRPWRMAASGSSLAGLWSAVRAGLGVTARTAIQLPSGLRILDPALHDLPPLPAIDLLLCRAESRPAAPAQRLHDILLAQLTAPGVEAEALNIDN
ncbi:LysR substrate-binding domain-containing protein [Chromobacterium piscinae]|uniref:LysR substrate-binding domain-containing protein n=2 Tax=Chromobacterium piscinae TaxID=686831 RepID=A0ABV0H184_9NEIS|nr:LysR substrate-binding domain-containing protein [Chromobacterium piscinae]MBX9299427.1 LysR family transcriptional regulator [Chromobacterium vaccinii]MBX9345564.1 LysR family transcriptional regulator [Chromobacterium vaccinii]MBX9356173.1 LysR family transcriptional regulator [Chromobacterium vaccinii]MCD4506825.1 LysR family transcriptional regulator [Chromobacterium piscinae]MCD5326215.1 LysR substrate-binding domain-containing protein [Chromobacterium piscinae]